MDKQVPEPPEDVKTPKKLEPTPKRKVAQAKSSSEQTTSTTA